MYYKSVVQLDMKLNHNCLSTTHLYMLSGGTHDFNSMPSITMKTISPESLYMWLVLFKHLAIPCHPLQC